ncbi:MAG TPA: hypothetical protein VHC50_03815, partial [Puia sp.]|nr:hypothetical protein [Puia sp.]
MKYRILFLLLSFLMASCLESAAQKNPQNLISGNFQQVTIDEFVQELESQTSYYFYYDTSRFDSLRITLSVNREPLSRVLELAFDKTDYHYAVDRHL